MDPDSHSKLDEAKLCSNRPGCVHDIWGAHLGHTVLSWRWCDSKPFNSSPSITASMAKQALTILLGQNNKSRSNGVTWVCYILRSHQSELRGVVPSCDVEFTIPDDDIERFRSSSHPEYAKTACGAFGALGPSLLAKYPSFFLPPSTYICTVPVSCKRRQTW